MKYKNKYVIGYVIENDQDRQCVYGRNKQDGSSEWCQPMTLFMANRQLKELISDAPKTIYELVPVTRKGRAK